MKKFVFSALICILLCLACSKDDDTTNNNVTGDWFLHKVTGGPDNSDDMLIDFEVRWLIKNNGSVVINNHNSLENVNTFLPGGTYNYVYDENTATGECNGTFTINNIVFDCWNTTETQGTILTQNVENGYQLFISRVPGEL
ncbi:hypothetical protein E0W68_08155 [Flavobacterium salilacus subsp. salilacus]|uniref:hypothetical protein n=1 Tax=Flavobacterium TaxID=237 RepID=UPI001074EC97|nr:MULTISPECIES: hypothetical protein [Flavobacterium]KAF2518718.1 hypothetical protein E0W68_08155 [Flavobacterium salilacus subsp. salilacus]MBE1613683.1 hypothetical protein [Flavobacterium sp. SaA2.13]